MSASDLRGEFPRDPRSAVNAPLRAADTDRDIVHRVLADAYADGRLDIIDAEVRRLEKKQLKRDLKQTRELPAPDSDEDRA